MVEIPAPRSLATTPIVASSMGRTYCASWVPRRTFDICGPSMCKPTMPPSPLARIAASAAAATTSWVSVITVGVTATVPNWRCAEAMAHIPSGVGHWFNNTPPPPLTCKSTKPGLTVPPTCTTCALAGTARTGHNSTTRPCWQWIAKPFSNVPPSNT